MNVVIVGAGEIGSQIASALHSSHSVVVMDSDDEHEQNVETLDVQFVRGNGADPNDLKAVGADRADAFIAATSNDDVNVLACLAAKGLGAKETMAFVTRQRYVDAFSSRGPMEGIGLIIDRLLWPQRTLANQIVDIVRIPRALDSASLAGGRIKVVEYRLEEGDPFMGVPLATVTLPQSVLVAGSIRGESFIVPSGATVLCPDDKVVFMGTGESMRLVEARFAPRKRNTSVAVVGGGNVGFMVAEQLQSNRTHLTIIEKSEQRCERLAEWLPRALILRGDGTDLELLEQERIEDVDVMVAVTDDDGKNLLTSLLAKQLGIPKVITRVGRSRNRRLFERVGIDAPLTPRTAAVTEVLNWLKVDEVDHLATIEDRAEVMELTYPMQCNIGRVRDLGAPPNSLIGAILRNNKVIIPDGDTTIQHGDHLFIVTTPDNVPAVHGWLEQKRVDA
jgi:trk system potassium uptake protein TrkA